MGIKGAQSFPASLYRRIFICITDILCLSQDLHILLSYAVIWKHHVLGLHWEEVKEGRYKLEKLKFNTTFKALH